MHWAKRTPSVPPEPCHPSNAKPPKFTIFRIIVLHRPETSCAAPYPGDWNVILLLQWVDMPGWSIGCPSLPEPTMHVTTERRPGSRFMLRGSLELTFLRLGTAWLFLGRWTEELLLLDKFFSTVRSVPSCSSSSPRLHYTKIAISLAPMAISA